MLKNSQLKNLDKVNKKNLVLTSLVAKKYLKQQSEPSSSMKALVTSQGLLA
jgi:hypothetical protein